MSSSCSKALIASSCSITEGTPGTMKAFWDLPAVVTKAEQDSLKHSEKFDSIKMYQGFVAKEDEYEEKFC